MGYMLVGSGWHYRTLQTDSTEVNFPTVLKVENPKSGYPQFFQRNLSPWLADSHPLSVHTWPFLYAWAPMHGLLIKSYWIRALSCALT